MDSVEINDHVKQIIAFALKIDEKRVFSDVQLIPLENGNYLCHMDIKIDGKDLNQRQVDVAVVLLRQFGLPGVRILNVQIPAEA